MLRRSPTSLCEALTREEFKCLEMEDNKTNQLYRRRYVHAFSLIISIVIALLLVAFILGSTSPARTKRLLRRVASHPGRNWFFGGRGDGDVFEASHPLYWILGSLLDEFWHADSYINGNVSSSNNLFRNRRHVVCEL